MGGAPTEDGEAGSSGPLGRVLARLFGGEADVVRDRVFQVLLLGSVISPMGSSVVSPVLESLASPYGVSVARVGLLMAAFTAPSIVAIPLVGALSDRVGRRPVLAAGLALLGVAGGAAALTTDFRVVVALRLVQGVGYCGIGPMLIASVGDLYGGEREATAQGLRFATVGLSLALFPVLAGLLVTRDFRLPFLLFLLGLPVALVVLRVFDEPTASGADGDQDAPAATDNADSEDGSGTLLALLRDPLVLAVLAGRAVPSFLWFAFLTYASVVTGRLLESSAEVAGLLVGLASLGSAVGGTQVGRLTAAVDGRGLPLAATMAVCGAGLAVFGLAPSLPVAAVGAAVAGAGFGTVLTLYRSTVTGLADARARGGLVSVGESVGRVGSTAAPLALGALVAAGGPLVGFETALRAVLVGTAVLGATVGIGLGLLTGRAHRRANGSGSSW
ncbi:MFS transporter [Halobacteriales archaeon QS_4_70_19]|nr:MAG: MFS transporter [Halobacteriales archaeon QS_4_70_19]